MNTKDFLNSIRHFIYALVVCGSLNFFAPEDVTAAPQPAPKVMVAEQAPTVSQPTLAGIEIADLASVDFDTEAIDAQIDQYIAEKGWQTFLDEVNKALEIVTFVAHRFEMEEAKQILSKLKEENADFSSDYFLADLQNLDLDKASEIGVNPETVKTLCKNIAYLFHVVEWNAENDFDASYNEEDEDDELTAAEMEYWTQEGKKRLDESIKNNDAVLVQVAG